MKYDVGDIVICHFDEDSRLVPERYYEEYQDRIGKIVEVWNRDNPLFDISYILDISEPGDNFFEEELSIVVGAGPIDFDEVFELIN